MIIPLLMFVVYALFTLTKLFPYDPVIQSLQNKGVDFLDSDGRTDQPIYDSEFIRLGLDKPAFYGSITPSKTTALLPSIKWHGVDNQFHSWFVGLISLDFGSSSIDGSDTWSKTIKAFGHTLRYMIPALLLTFFLAFGIGILLGRHPDRLSSRVLDVFFYSLASLPVFWVASLAVVYLTTPLYSKYLDIFPRVDVFVSGDIPMTYYTLPIILVVIFSVAYLATQVKNVYLDIAKSPYIHSLKARGLSHRVILMNHMLPNMMISLVTIFTLTIPIALGGSVVIEQIFNIPGVGRLLLSAINGSDWMMVVPIVVLIAIITTLSYLLSDILYAIFDPRVKQQLTNE